MFYLSRSDKTPNDTRETSYQLVFYQNSTNKNLYFPVTQYLLSIPRQVLRTPTRKFLCEILLIDYPKIRFVVLDVYA